MTAMDAPLEEFLDHFRTPVFPGSYFISFEGIEGAGKSTRYCALNVTWNPKLSGF